jgi:hypothetical protein
MPSKSKSSNKSKIRAIREKVSHLLILLRCTLRAHVDEISSSYVLPSSGRHAHQLDHSDDRAIDEPYEALETKLNEILSYTPNESPSLICMQIRILESAYFMYVELFEEYYTHNRKLWKDGSATDVTLSDEAQTTVNKSEVLVSGLQKEIEKKFDALLVAVKKLKSLEADAAITTSKKNQPSSSVKSRRSASLSVDKNLRKLIIAQASVIDK